MLHGAEFNENDNFQKSNLIMHGYKILHGGDNKNENFNQKKLLIHGHKFLMYLLGSDINGNENYRKDKLIILSFGIEGLR